MDDRTLTQSELASWLRCRRRWWLGYHRALRKRHDMSSPLTVGTLVHAGLEAYYRPEDRRHPVDVVKERALSMIDAEPAFADQTAKDATLAGIMLDGYMEWLEAEGADADLDVYAAEQPVQVVIGPGTVNGTVVGPYNLKGKIDARARRRTDGAHLQLEHKSVGNLADLPKLAQINFQYLTYDLVAFMASMDDPDIHRTDGVLLNMLRKVKRSARANPPFFGRHEVHHNTAELRAHWQHVLAIAADMEQAAERLAAGESHQRVVPPTPTRDCSWGCQFYAVCPLFDDGSDAEGMIAAAYEEHDPLERYADTELPEV